MFDSSDVLRVLGAFGPVEWARISLGRDPIDNMLRPPLIVWRYAKPSIEVATKIELTVASFAGSEEWEFRSAGRNLVIVPKALDARFKLHPTESDSAVMANIKVSDPNFCMRANVDLVVLFQEIEAAAGL